MKLIDLYDSSVGSLKVIELINIYRSCWAFSVSSVFSFSIFNRTNQNVVLSPQDLVDCSSVFGNAGCDGGWPPAAFEYIAVYKLNTEESYPYTSGTDGKTV